MIVKKHIKSTLITLDRRFSEDMKKPNQGDPVFFSKLAILEYCGWIEESLDEIVRRAAKGKIRTSEFRNMLESIILNTHGFEYKKNFRPMLSRVIGLQGAEFIEKSLKDAGLYEILVSELNNMKELRNNAAHTTTKGTTISYPAPSKIREGFEAVLPVFKKMYSDVVSLS